MLGRFPNLERRDMTLMMLLQLMLMLSLPHLSRSVNQAGRWASRHEDRQTGRRASKRGNQVGTQEGQQAVMACWLGADVCGHSTFGGVLRMGGWGGTHLVLATGRRGTIVSGALLNVAVALRFQCFWPGR